MYLKRLFRDLFIREGKNCVLIVSLAKLLIEEKISFAGFQFDYVFDWTILKYQDSHSARGPRRAAMVIYLSLLCPSSSSLTLLSTLLPLALSLVLPLPVPFHSLSPRKSVSLPLSLLSPILCHSTLCNFSLCLSLNSVSLSLSPQLIFTLSASYLQLCKLSCHLSITLSFSIRFFPLSPLDDI